MCVQPQLVHEGAGNLEAILVRIQECSTNYCFDGVRHHVAAHGKKTGIRDDAFVDSGGETSTSKKRIAQVVLANLFIPDPDGETVALAGSACDI